MRTRRRESVGDVFSCLGVPIFYFLAHSLWSIGGEEEPLQPQERGAGWARLLAAGHYRLSLCCGLLASGRLYSVLYCHIRSMPFTTTPYCTPYIHTGLRCSIDCNYVAARCGLPGPASERVVGSLCMAACLSPESRKAAAAPRDAWRGQSNVATSYRRASLTKEIFLLFFFFFFAPSLGLHIIEGEP